ncbi:hypothetical protein VL20_2461 [Microcystis panniformis FACHB-1757]|uniref:Uncharacterized protein n=1 Tax=Microcystis panniformis FACHB-1757 TaxID=1638788 RepID=A0A0K1S083_9CHRO|nr:hypothetical protein VL20_2461 [Microcystis panniformis FACHB-1757]
MGPITKIEGDTHNVAGGPCAWGENSGTFSLKMGKTPHPTPCHQEKLFAANPN